MRFRLLRHLLSAFGALAFVALSLCCSASASITQGVVYAFTGGVDGGDAATSVTFDTAGHAYVTAVTGGADGCGTVDRLTPGRGPWSSHTLWTFTCGADGKNPYGGVTLDAAGNVYGTTVAGGNGGACAGDGCGVVYRIGLRGGERVLYDFKGGRDGFGPGGPVVFDAHGDLFGATPDGGLHGDGVVYELTPRPYGPWRLHVVHAFRGLDDGSSGFLGRLHIDGVGDIFGVAELGGAHQAGTVFEVIPGTNGTWTFVPLHEFVGTPDGAFPYGGVIADPRGDLFGTTYYGGTTGNGAVFELRRHPDGKYDEHVLYGFANGSDGANPTSALAFDPAGDIFGTTSAGGGSCGCGTIFKIDAVTGMESVVHSFGSSSGDGQYPYYGLTPDARGELFTSTVQGGTYGQGVIYGM